MVKEAFSTEGVLIEHIAERLALQILTRWEAVEKVQIRVSKVHPPVGILAQDAYAEVEMVRMATP
jgi:dihydroneopterin aldolase